MYKFGLHIYLIFITSWFLHLPARIPVLGILRFDLLLVAILAFLAYSSSRSQDGDQDGDQDDTPEKWLRRLIIFAIIAVPFVEWPGSVLKDGIPDFIKAVVFYYFTVCFVRTEVDLKKFIYVFLGCQLFRIIEPLYLHHTIGYWGSKASMLGGEEFLNRLSGSPYDVINPNGLAFVVCAVVPLLYYLAGQSWLTRIASLVFLPASLYALLLSGSRTGIITIVAIFAAIVWKSKYRISVAVFCVMTAIIGFSILPPDMQDRYLSITGSSSKNTSTVVERFDGMVESLKVGFRKPFFGHGLGTSAEANANFTTSGPYAYRRLPAHDLYLELLVELGIAGLIIFLFFMRSIIIGFTRCGEIYRKREAGMFLFNFVQAMQVWVIVNLVTSLASYALSLYPWYLLAGLLVVLNRLSNNIESNMRAKDSHVNVQMTQQSEAQQVRPRVTSRLR